MSPSRYYVKVIAGDKVAYNQNCNGYPTASSCTLRVYNHHTPEMRRVAKVEPIQYPESKAYSPGDLIQVYGRLFTEAFGSNNQTDNGRGVSFRRVHINGYSCQLLNPSTQDFYHMKLTYETSVYGTFHCKTQGTFVGYSNMSFIITGIYGRSVASKSLYKVSATDTVHMIQTYADVTGVSPKVGSTEGGTKLTITGKHFDKDAKVLVGGVPCRLTNDRVTPTSLTCITGPASHEKPFRYAGSRGIHMKYWNGTRVGSSQLENIFKLNGSESDYQGRHVIQQAGYTWDLAHDFVATFEGIFVAPVTDRYKFYFKSDDAGTAHFYCGERMENKVDIYYTVNEVSSFIFLLTSSSHDIPIITGQQCYFKTAVVDWGGPGNKYIAVLRQKTKLTRSQSYEVFNEKQLIDFEALKLAEKQAKNKISLNTWATQSGVEEQQTVQVICTQTCTNSYFRLIYNGGKTPYMSFLVSRSAFTKELSSIVGVSGVTIQVSKSDISNGKQFVITFKGKGADYPLLGKEIRSSENMQVTVRETVKGVPDFKTFSLNLAGRTTAPIAFNATAAVLQEELFKLTSAHCSETLLPSGTSSRVLATFNFEDGSITEGLSGDIKQVDIMGGFCGRRSLKNPYYLFKAGTTSHLSWGKHRAFSMLSYPKLCFAHRGVFRPQIGINGVFQYTDNLGASKSQSTTKISAVTLSMSKNTWGYSCFDFATLLTTHYATLTTASIEEIYLYKIGDFYVDAVYIGKDNLLADGSDLRVPPALAAGEAIASVAVVKNEPNADYDVTIETFNCGHMVSLLKLPYATPSSTSGSKVEHRWQNGNNMTIQRLVEATPPMSGTFDLTHTSDEGVVETLKNIQVNITEGRFKNLLESLNGFGQAKVSRSGSCHEIDYTIEWLTNGGSKSLLQINTTNIVGAPDLVGEVKKTTSGGVFHDPIPGEMLRQAYTKPQVVTINGIPSYCRGDCEFEYKAENTPVVQSFSPNTGSWNTVVTIIGEKFGTPATANVSVHIGRANCTVTQHTDTQLQCEVIEFIYSTVYFFRLHVIISVLCSMQRLPESSTCLQLFKASISPVTAASTSGGALLNITGTGFGPNSEVYVGDKQCMRKKDARYSSTHLVCMLPPHAAGTGLSVFLSVTIASSFTYSDASLPIISAIAPTTSTVIGGQSLNITGSNFGSSISDVKITIAGKDCAISSWSMTFLQCSLPSAPPGVHPVNVLVAETGIADLTQNNISGITYTFQVDGISPQHGSIYGGSMLTITGSGFVNDPSLNISIGNQAQCMVQSVSNNRVTCKVGSLAKTHLITNDGIHTVYGRGFAWTPQVLRIYVGDSVTWRWRVSGTSNGWGIRVFSTSTPDATEYDNVGFNSGPTKTQMGWYQYKFTKPGVYYSFSGYLDSGSTVWMRGTIRVMEKMQYFPVRVMLKGYSPTSVGSPGEAPRSKRSSSCSVLDKVAGCVPSNVNGSLTFVSGDPCYTPVISTTSPQSGTIDTVVTITGTGFAPDNCANSVMIGDYPCDVISSTTTEIKCMPKPTKYDIAWNTVTVNNLGEASVDDNHRFALVPNINAVTPASGSLAGGTTLSVTGFGFNTLSQLNAISISGTTCVVKQSTAFQLTCVTSSVNAETSGNVTLFRTPYTSTCTGACLFSYLNAMTPTVTAISPNMVNQSDTTITLTGTGLTNDKMAVSVLVGKSPCAVISSTTTSIQCTLAHLAAGTHNVKVLIQPYGYAVFNPTSINTISSAPVASLTPTSGSMEGGTVVTFNGNGFLVEGFLVLMDGRPCTITPPLTNNKVFTCVTSKSFSTLVDVTFNPPSFPTLKYLYTDQLTPVVTAIQPTGGTTGDVVTLTGRRLNSTNINVTIGESLCIITFMNYSHIECTVPSHRGGTFPVKVYDSVAGLGASNLLFTFVFNTTSVAPLSGGFAGGYKLTLTGSGYDSLMRIKVCDNFCFINVSAPVSRTSVECTITAFNVDKVCPISVMLGAISTYSPSNFTYAATKTPIVQSLSPVRGGTGGGVNVTITGTGFVTDKSLVKVTIAGVPCTVLSSSLTTIMCQTEYSARSISSLVEVNIIGKGLAINTNAVFQYVDLWSSIYTWGGLPPPTAGDLVVIKAGQTVVLDVNTPIFKLLLIQGGTLIFDEKDLELQAEYILITNGGTLQVGYLQLEENHFEHKAIITLHGHLRARELPIYGAKVLGVRNGTLDMHGRHIPITWTHLTQTSNVGDNTIHLKHAVNWNVGDEIVIATTGHRHSQKETETAKITSVSSNNKLTLDKQLKYEHLCVVQTFTGSVTVETCAEVGLLTRNIVFRGSDNQEWHDVIPACPEGFDTGEFATQTCFQGRFGEEEGSDEFGAVMMIHQRHPSSNTARARIEFVEFSHVGQAFRLGRYPIHFHLMGDASRDNYVRGCAIHKSFNRAVTIHGTNNLLVEHNVIYNIKGGAVFIEDGVEYGNLQYNLVLFCKQSTSLQNDDITPAAFWATNPNNTLQHNAAAGGTHFGFWYRMRHRPDGPSYDPSICPRQIPLGVFQNNTVHSQGWFGLWTFQIFYPKKGGSCWATEPEPATFDSLTTWNCEKGAELVNAGAIKFKNCIMLNNELAGIETKQIGDRNVKWGQAGIYNSVIISHGDVSKPSGFQRTNSGVVLPFSEAWLLSNVTFINFDQSTSAALAGTSIAGTCSGLCGGFPYRMSGLKFVNSPNKARFRWEHEMVIYDLDGTLTGTNSPGVVTPTNPSLPTSCVVNAAFSIGESGFVCPGGMKFHRIAWNKPIPSSLEAKNVTLTSQYGTTIIHYRKKRMTHKPGWMATVVGGESYRWTFVNAEQITNISYTAGFYDFESSDCVIISHKFTQKPDNVQIYQSVARNTTNQMVTCAANKNGEYFFDANLKELHYVVSGSDPVSKRSANVNAKDRSVKFNAFRCFYKDCIIPEPTGNNSKELARERPANAVFWSNVNSWRDADEGWGGNDGNGAFSLPKNGSKIKIKSGVWMVADINFPTMTELHVEGTLELDGNAVNGEYKTFNLEATYIIITGRFIVGWEDNTFLGQANIILKGDINTPEYRPSPQVTLGSKAIGVFGGLDLHGKRRDIVWTKLAKETGVDKSTITLKQAVDWLPGEEIVLTTTSFDPWETETFKIRSVSADKRTLTLNTTTKFTHLVQYTDHAGTLKSYSIAADVGLLSRNIKIIGQDYNNLYKESFGVRVLVGSYQNRTGTEFRGFARIEDVEIYHGGQEGHIDSYDPRYALAFLRSGTVDKDYFPSYVRRISAHHCFNTAIGVFGAKGLPITNNVIHHTVGPGIRVEGENQRVENNLVTIARTRSVYQDRNEIDIILWKAAIEINEGKGTVMSGNVVAGSERAGYRIDGEECSTSVNSALEANEARAVMQGVWMNKDGFPSCSRINNFIHKAFEVGIYTQVTGNIEIENALVTDSTLGIVNLFIGPASKTHAYAAKHASIKKSTIVAVSKPGEKFTFGTRSSFKHRSTTPHHYFLNNGRAGIAFPIFMSGHNAAPQKPHCGSISYSALGGRTDISETTFVNFDDTDCTRDRHTVFMTNPAGEDFMHPIYTQTLHFVNSSRDSRVFLHRPSLGKINPSDCVDMECDGMKTVLMVDKDGSFLGSPGTIIPEAEFEWDGDRRRGLGDYRIPKTMLTRLNGSRIPINEIAPFKGILRNTASTMCTNRPAWRAHECHGYQHEILIIESLDVDSETRRLSPVALLSDGYIDLLNGPQDHGWCDGYTCQERLSTFHGIVVLNTTYSVFFSGTAPQKLRLRLPNVQSNQSMVLRIFFTTPRRLDIYINNNYIPPLNDHVDASGKHVLKKPTTPTEYRPTISDPTGANFFDRDNQMLHVTIKGNTPIDMYTAPVVVISFGIPPVTPNEFFNSAGLVTRLALFLGVDPSKVRIVDIVRVGSVSGRRKRSTQSSTVSVEVGDPPSTVQTTPAPVTIAPALPPGSTTTTPQPGTTTPSPGAAAIQLLQEFTAKIVNALQTGSLGSQLNTTILSLNVVDPLPPPVTTWT
uniref:G8 domain-containing protein n=1 Tax=Ciona savignyi TaxID=51511 RepID=H2Y4C5_CIOSA